MSKDIEDEPNACSMRSRDPIVVVDTRYGGAVISAAAAVHINVKSLVYCAASHRLKLNSSAPFTCSAIPISDSRKALARMQAGFLLH